jgi:UDP-N-acetylmuramoyl-L-alanyl-D-glutamate--2,6-diaminopimelate ligase
MHLGQLLAGENVQVEGSLDQEIRDIVCDSRQVQPHTLFVAIRGGQEVDRHFFVGDAAQRGAAAIVVEDDIDCGPTTRILVQDSRRLLPRLASRFQGEPSLELQCVGVTGTNGKTTTAWLLHNIQQTAGQVSAYIGTMGYICAESEVAVANTTPEAPTLQQLLRDALNEGATSVAMEVSSHALALHRTDEIQFAAALFTNLTRDHLDFHGTVESYLAAKGRLFQELDDQAMAVLNRDDPVWDAMAARTSAQVLTYGVEDHAAHVHPVSISASLFETRCRVAWPQGEFEVVSPLTGRFNLSNIMAAVAGGLALGVEADAMCEAIAQAPRVPGRFERIDEGQSFGVLVDYAHTPAGLQTCLEAARELTQGRLFCVFGCGGDRDVGKRPLMGQVAAKLADAVYLTSDNPRSESPQQILEQIQRGMDDSMSVRVDVDRRVAIEAALNEACPGDLVVIAGKGDEPYQLLADGPIDFDDRLIAREVLKQAAQ